MPDAIYVLCFLTCAAIAALLLRAYGRTRYRVLLWTGLGFLALSLENLILMIDYVFLPDTIDLSGWRKFPALLAGILIVYGLIWDAD